MGLPAGSVIIFFVRYPQPGKVKTRLAADIGAKRAAMAHKVISEMVFREALKSGAPCVVAFSPPGKKAAVMKWLAGASAYIPQKGRGLGNRMNNAFVKGFEMGYENMVLIGSDIPGLKAALLRSALKKACASGAVIGPAKDGGYYLIGFSRRSFTGVVFKDISWGTPGVFRATAGILRREKAAYSTLGFLEDVDDHAAYRRLFLTCRFEISCSADIICPDVPLRLS